METYGFQEFASRLQRLGADLPSASDTFVAEMGTRVTADVKQGTPVDSGTLKRSWAQGAVSNAETEVGTNLEYAEPIEEGFIHRNSGAKVQGAHMLERAVANEERQLPEHMQHFFDRLTKDIQL